ncbi:YdgA family protein [Endozoicomonas sp. Mp262]|uniref:YdgA family protein n=1 Tax=Endozoicomonas sp. Mp262 TaxID=2919499 RepID=UPI0021DB7D34
MKKLLLGFSLILIGAATSASYYIGLKAEQYYEEFVQLRQNSPIMSGFVIKNAHFERGIFSSNWRLELSIKAKTPQFDSLIVITRSKLRHGPILWTDQGLKPGLFTTSDTVTLDGVPDKTIQFINQYMNGHIAKAKSYADFNRQLTIHLKVPGFDINTQDTRLSFGGIQVHQKGDLLRNSMSATIDISTLAFTNPTGSLELQPGKGSFQYTRLDEFITLGSLDLNLPKLALGSPQSNLTLNQIAFGIKQTMENEKLNQTGGISVNNIDSPFPISSASYDIELKQINPDVNKTLAEITSQLNNLDGSSTGLTPEQNEQLRKFLYTFLQKGLQFNQQLTIDALGGNLLADLDIEYLGLTNKDPVAIQDPNQHLRAIKAQLNIRADERAVMSSPLSQLASSYIQQGFIARRNGQLTVKAELNQGLLTVNNQSVPLDKLTSP